MSKSLKAFAFAVAVFLAAPALAQNAGYAPPPMFEDPTPPMARPEAQSPVKAEPAKPLVAAPKTPPAKPVAPVIAKAPVPPKKPSAPVVDLTAPSKPVPAKAPEVKSVEAPAKVAEPKAEVVAPAVSPERTPTMTAPTKPVKRELSQSAIKGPKTMPALPTQKVEAEETFYDMKPKAEKELTILERQQIEAQKAKAQDEAKKPDPVITTDNPRAPASTVAPVRFEAGEQNVLKRSIPFSPGQIALEQVALASLAAGVNKELDSNEGWRAEIRSYATPYGTGLSSDKRIALSRALSLRTALIAQGVSASRIDVRAEGGGEGSSKPGDRIDLYLFSPKE